MPGLLTLLRSRWLTIGMLVLTLGVMMASRASWQAKARALEEWQGQVQSATSLAAGSNGLLRPDQVVPQINMLGAGLADCKAGIEAQNAAVLDAARAGDAMAAESERAQRLARTASEGTRLLAQQLERAAKRDAPARAAPSCQTPGDVLAAMKGSEQ